MINNEPQPIRFVSLGPGDPELLTLKALKALQEADVIFCASTSRPGMSERSRSAELLRSYPLQGEVRTFLLPMSKQRDAALEVYRQLFEDARNLRLMGRKVAIAVEGDAGVYASMHYVLELFEAEGTPVEQLCGIPSFIAAGGMAHLHLMQQEQRLLVVPGLITAGEIESFLSHNYVLVIMKLSQCEDAIKHYMKSHPAQSYHYFENVSTEQAVYLNDAEEILAKPFPYFSIMVIQ